MRPTRPRPKTRGQTSKHETKRVNNVATEHSHTHDTDADADADADRQTQASTHIDTHIHMYVYLHTHVCARVLITHVRNISSRPPPPLSPCPPAVFSRQGTGSMGFHICRRGSWKDPALCRMHRPGQTKMHAAALLREAANCPAREGRRGTGPVSICRCASRMSWVRVGCSSPCQTRSKDYLTMKEYLTDEVYFTSKEYPPSSPTVANERAKPQRE